MLLRSSSIYRKKGDDESNRFGCAAFGATASNPSATISIEDLRNYRTRGREDARPVHAQHMLVPKLFAVDRAFLERGDLLPSHWDGNDTSECPSCGIPSSIA
jgi:hypothetical protein